MKGNSFKIFSIIVFIICIILMTVICIPLISSFFGGKSDQFKEFIDGFGPFGLIVMLLIQIAQIVVAIIPGEVVEFVAGTVYGWFGGLIFCLVGVAIGQTIVFVAVRFLGKDLVEKAAGSEAMQKFKFLNDEKKLRVILFFLFFIPGTPKDLLTYIVPLTKIKLLDFLIITLVARIPSIVSSTLAGAAFGENDLLRTVIIYAVIGVVSLICAIGYKLWEKKHDGMKAQ